MLAAHHRISRSRDFSQVTRKGKRGSSRTVIVHLLNAQTSADIARTGGPRWGFIVSKAVGNAVIRHRTSRRLRHVCARLSSSIDSNYDVVIRALPRSATASSEELARDIHTAITKIMQR